MLPATQVEKAMKDRDLNALSDCCLGDLLGAYSLDGFPG